MWDAVGSGAVCRRWYRQWRLFAVLPRSQFRASRVAVQFVLLATPRSTGSRGFCLDAPVPARVPNPVAVSGDAGSSPAGGMRTVENGRSLRTLTTETTPESWPSGLWREPARLLGVLAPSAGSNPALSFYLLASGCGGTAFPGR